MSDLDGRPLRAMGMGCGLFLMAVAALLAFAMASVVYGELFGAKSSDPHPLALAVTCAVLALGLGLYGRSLFRRARSDASFTSTIDAPEQGDHRVLAWIALTLGTSLIAGVVVGTVIDLVQGKLPPATIFGLPALSAMPISAGRYLWRRRAAAAASRPQVGHARR